MEQQNLLTRWVIERIQTEYKDDIALLAAVKGHSTGGDGHGEVFDYFIPKTEKGYGLSQTFIIDGVGHDLYPRSWERVEKSADLEEMTITLANAEILYAASKEEAERFYELQKRLETNLNDPVFVYRKALEQLDEAVNLFRMLLFEEKAYRVRSEACFIHLCLSKAVAFMNHTYTDSPIFTERQAYTDCPESRIDHCPGLDLVPESFFEHAHLLLCADHAGEIKRIIYELIRSVKKFVLDRSPKTDTVKADGIETAGLSIQYQELADWYQELSLTWRRINFFCENNMVEEAYKDACYLQDELIVIAREFRMEELNLLDSFRPDCLTGLALRSRKLEEIIRGILSQHGIKIREYASMQDFLAANA